MSHVETRTPAQIREHYEIEKELAARLRNAGKEDRRRLYTTLYDELYRRVPLHPQLTQKADPAARAEAVAVQMRLLRRFLTPGSVFLEVGPGDCSLAFEAAKSAKKVYAVDVSEEITKGAARPANFELILSDGSSIPVPAGSVRVAYSNQLMEHLHPDDALEQLRNIYAALAPGGKYICITPNRLTGPHDVSEYFDEIATGFHLKEYTATELARIFKAAGFAHISAFVSYRERFFAVPVFLLKVAESVVAILPRSSRRQVARRLPFRALLRAVVVGEK
jgi:SAM-dependent methyltransferase